MDRLAGMILKFSNCEIISVSNDRQMDQVLYLEASYENNEVMQNRGPEGRNFLSAPNPRV